MWSSLPDEVQSLIREHDVPMKVARAEDDPDLIPDESVIVAGFAHRDGETLFVKSTKPCREWELPGGRLEPDEDPSDAVAREVTEETGYEVTDTDPLVALLWTFPDRILTQIVFSVTVGDQTENPVDEIEAVEWQAGVPENTTYGESGRKTHELLIKQEEDERAIRDFFSKALGATPDNRRVAAGAVATGILAGVARKAYSEYKERAGDEPDTDE